MIYNSDLIGYLLAILIGLTAPLGKRLESTGELKKGVFAHHPIILLLTVLLYGFANFVSFFYLSWAVLSWKHILTFFVVYIVFGGLLTNALQNASGARVVLITLTILEFTLTMMLLFNVHIKCFILLIF